MKQKTILYNLIGGLSIPIFGFLILTNAAPQPTHDPTPTPIIIDHQNPITQANSTINQVSSNTPDNLEPDQKQPTPILIKVPTTTAQKQIYREPIVANSPKQTEIRQSIEKEYVYYPLLSADDPSYPTNWAAQQVNAPAAWDITTGSSSTIVAVIDTGFALNHEDLRDRWAINSQETGNTTSADSCWTGSSVDKKTNNCDDDQNGYIDDWRGWNFFLGDNNTQTGRDNPSGAGVTHGTQTAGVVGSTGNNTIGTTSISWSTTIMPLQAMSDDGPGYTSDIVAAIYYAVDNGADVINLSLGGYEYDGALADATDYAYSNNVIVVAAAGNCGIVGDPNCSTVPTGAMLYPAINDHVVSVGATNSSSTRANFSSYGPDLDITAPGSGAIVAPSWSLANSTSLYTNSLYGTSFASPQVASLVALIKAIRPSSSVNDITSLLLATATKPAGMNGALYTNEFGHGIINAGSAVAVASALNINSSQPSLAQTGGATSEHSVKTNESIRSGCKTVASQYCTVWFRNESLGRDRFLPYQLANVSGNASWTWSGAILASGDWKTKAISGDFVSTTPYFLLQK